MSRWEEFLKDSIGDTEQINKLRSWMGKLFSDGQRPESLLVLSGPGPSGKSMLLSLLVAMVGNERSLTRLPDMGKPFDVAKMKGKKLIVLDVEQAKKKKISAGIKTLLGNDHLVGRERYKKSEIFAPECGVACSVNLVDFDDALTGRILKIDMKQTADRDPNLLSDLLSDAVFIKDWALSL